MNSSQMANETSPSEGGESCPEDLHVKVFLASMDIFPFLLGQPVVAMLLWMTFTSKKPKDILNCNLAIFHNLQYLVSLSHVIPLFKLPKFHIRVLNFLLVYAQIGGPMSMSLISLERYVAVVHPTSYPLLTKYRYREIGAFLVWLCSVTSSVILHIKKEDNVYVEAMLKSLPLFVMVFMAETMVFCSLAIARVLRKAGPGQDKLHPAKRKAFFTVCATTAINLFFYIPVASMQRSEFADKLIVKCMMTPISVLLLSIASVVHPLFYLSTQGKLPLCRKRQ